MARWKELFYEQKEVLEEERVSWIHFGAPHLASSSVELDKSGGASDHDLLLMSFSEYPIPRKCQLSQKGINMCL